MRPDVVDLEEDPLAGRQPAPQVAAVERTLTGPEDPRPQGDGPPALADLLDAMGDSPGDESLDLLWIGEHERKPALELAVELDRVTNGLA